MLRRKDLLEAAAIPEAARVLYQLLPFIQFACFLYAFGSARATDAMIIAETLPSLSSNRPERGFACTSAIDLALEMTVG
jgi:hypothetical protein